MGTVKKSGRMTGRGKLYSVLAGAAGVTAVLFYFEHVAVIYIAAAVATGVLLLISAFSNLEEAAIHATEEAYMTLRSDGVFTEDEDEAAIAPKPAQGRANLIRKQKYVTGTGDL